MHRRLLAFFTTAVAATALTVAVGPPVSAATGGPIILMGIDAEDGGVGGHGPITTYVDVTNSILAGATNGGTGLLVFGCTTSGTDHVSLFWQAVATGTGAPLTCSEGAGIATQSLAGFKMIGVASDIVNTPNGGLTQAENDALGLRASDVAAFVNGGGGLLGFSSAKLTNPYPYLGGVGSFTFATPAGYNDITPTTAGGLVGITNALDVSAWHDEYLTFPSFLSVLATNVATGNPAAIGGAQVVIVPPKVSDLAIVKTGPVGVTEGGAFSYVLTVTNNGPDTATSVVVTDVIPTNTTFVSATAGCVEAAGTVTCTVASLASSTSTAFTINLTAGSTGTEIVNTASVAGVESDPNATNNSSTVHTPLNHNPVCTAVTAGPNLWPPNHKLRTITLSGATDPDGNPLTWNVTGVTQDEPTNGLGDGDTAIDAVLGSGNTLQVRAERSGLGDGRVYRIAVTVTDGLGGSCTGVARIGVPHDQSPVGSIPVDSGGLYNSLV